MKTIEAVETVVRAANSANPDIRIINKIAVGQVIRQGDIYIHRVSDGHARGELAKRRQLVPGTNRGSRHVALPPIQVYDGTKLPPAVKARASGVANAILGPCLVIPADGGTIEHPEHANIDIRCGGTFQITYQLDQRTQRRVED